jgi:hypothetical protein
VAAAHADWPRKGLDRDLGVLKINAGTRYTPTRLWVELNLSGNRTGKRDFGISDRIRPRPGTNKLREASPSTSIACASASESAILDHVGDQSA